VLTDASTSDISHDKALFAHALERYHIIILIPEPITPNAGTRITNSALARALSFNDSSISPFLCIFPSDMAVLRDKTQSHIVRASAAPVGSSSPYGWTLASQIKALSHIRTHCYSSK
jgi:hypothetical protein